MAAAFLRAVLAGTLTAAVIPSLLLAVAASSDRWRSPGALPLISQIGIVAAVALAIVTTAALLVGLPIAIALRRFRLESTPTYVAAGASMGTAFAWAVLALVIRSAAPVEILFLAAASGAATGYSWWRSRRPRADARVRFPVGFESRRFGDLRPRSPASDLRVQSWPPKWERVGDISIRPLAFVMALGVVAMALVVAAAGEGRLDRLPPQPYFPAALRTAVLVDCDTGGARWPQYGTAAILRRPEPAIDDFEADWYSLHLRAAQERSLYEASRRPGATAFRTVRFTWLRSFHAPIVVRIDELASGRLRITAKQLSGYGGYGPGRVIKEVVRDLSPAETARFEQELTQDGVLRLQPVGCERGSDGAEWIIEANDRGRYHYLNRWSPADGPVRRLGDMMVGLSGLDPRPVY